MKKEIKGDVITITCDNLNEFFTEFKEYRHSEKISEVATQDNFGKYVEHHPFGGVFTLLMNTGKTVSGQDYLKDEISSAKIDMYDFVNDEKERINLFLKLPNLKEQEWEFYSPKISQVLKEIWAIGEMKNTHGLDLNWPQPSHHPDQPPTDKKKLLQALTVLKYQKSPTQAKNILAAHVGFKKEKKWFKDQVYLYSITQGNFTPKKEVICYAGPPGTGKTTFIYRLSQATGRPCQTIACAGQKEFNDFSILGTKHKPSLVAWTIKESGCRNLLILLDELEKVSNPQIQKDLIKLFDLCQQKEKLFDPYFQTEIDLTHLNFFATVNYSEELAPLLKNKLVMRKLEKFTPTEKEQILTSKSHQIEKNWGTAEGEIYSPAIITELSRLPEEGIRQSEAALHQILKEWIMWKKNPNNQGKKFSLSSEWLKHNTLIVPPSFQVKPKHYFLFVLGGIAWILLLVVIIKKWIIKK